MIDGADKVNESGGDRPCTGPCDHTLFPKTPWTQLLQGREGSREALTEMLVLYREPLYLVARAERLDHWDAEDVVSLFIAECFEKEGAFQKFDIGRGGKFRSYLRASIQNLIKSEWRKSKAQKRGGDQERAPLEGSLSSHLLNNAAVPVDTAYDIAFAVAWWENVKRRFLEEEGGMKDRGAIFNHLARGEDQMSETNQELAKKLGLTIAQLERQIRISKDKVQIIVMEEGARLTSEYGQIKEEVRALRDLLKVYWGREVE